MHVNFLKRMLRRWYWSIPRTENGEMRWGLYFRRLIIRLTLWFFGLTIGFTLLYRFVPVPATPLMFIRCVQQAGDSNREVRWEKDWVSLKEISPHLQLAVVCSEDQAFLEHETMVDISTGVTDATLQTLARLLANDPDLPATKVSLSSRTAESSTLRFAVKGSQVGLLAYLCDQVQLPIAGMRRIRLGRIALRDLPVGQWRYLGINERI